MIAQITNSVASPDVTQAVTTLIQVLFPHANAEQVVSAGLSIMTSIFVIARALRKIIPDKYQTGKWAQILKHCSLEINPTTPPAPPKP